MTLSTQFGNYFRQCRKALGLSLREFSRRNGFDPGNISKLERGVLTPPRSALILESYVKALKLAPASIERKKLIQLARDEGAAKLPQPPRGKRVSTWTRAITLELWADYFDAKYTLPHVVRQLVHGTIDATHLIRAPFPGLESVQRPGWDGIVETTRGNEFVPAGLSVWEMGVEKHPQRKAEGDFKKRTKDPLGLDRSEVTFIFVTPRKWPGKEKWCLEKKKLNAWKDVRVYDSETLEEWLETARGVDNWLARVLGRRPEAADDIEGYWDNLAASTKPSLSAEVFLVSREQNIKQLTTWLKSSPSVLALESSSPEDVIDFIAACYACLKHTECPVEIDLDPHDMAARTLIIRDMDAWRDISTAPNHLLLLPAPDLPMDMDMISEATRQGHHVLLSSHRFTTNRDQKQALSRPKRYELEKALITSGLVEKDAVSFSQQSGGSLTVLKRALSRNPTTKQPVWSEPGNARELIPFILLGGWNDSYDADRHVIEKLSGKPYEENLQIMHRWLNTPDSPVLRVLTNWRLVSREDSWRLAAASITGEHLKKFEEIAVEVLAEIDPKYELPNEERRYASIHGKVFKYSPQIRSGICETLALLGCKSGDGLLQDPINPERRADHIVGRLLNTKTSWQQWASLSALLPVLAEASPEVFLSAIADDLKKTEPILCKLFMDSDEDPIFSSCTHAGLLWGLETLAWNPTYLTRVSLILARLHEIDPQGSWSNRPLKSLQEIFLPWHPHTTATVRQRIDTIKKIAEKYEAVAWEFLLNLMPNVMQFSTNTRMPLWRGWSLSWGHVTTNIEYWEQVEACADCLVNIVGTGVTRWLRLIKEFEHFPKEIQQQLLTRLKQLDLNEINMEEKRKLTDNLRRQVTRHRRFADAKWAMSPDIVDQLEQLQNHFVPVDLVAKHLWLFEFRPPGFDELIEGSWRKSEEAINNARAQALRDIHKKRGLAGILELAGESKTPSIVGGIYVSSGLYTDEDQIIPELLNPKTGSLNDFACGTVYALFEQRGWDWVTALPLPKWSPEQSGAFLSLLPFERRTWNIVEHLGVEVDKSYWELTRQFHREPDKEEVEYAITKLLHYERPLQAIEVLSMALDDKCGINPDLIMQALELELKVQQQDNSRDAMVNHGVYQIQELFKYLQKHPQTDAYGLARLEWQYLGLLDDYSGASPVALQKSLQQDPKFYCQLISIIFRSDKEPEDESKAPGEKEKALAHNAYNLLNRWNAIPGTGEDGVIDERTLMDWVKTAREICTETGHLVSCDIHIGETLAKEPEKEGGAWPSIPVRDVIDEIDSEDLAHGFEIGIRNKRGVYSKGHGEGGLQERLLAEKYENFARRWEMEWPITAASLRRVARIYEDEAKREDERAKHWGYQ